MADGDVGEVRVRGMTVYVDIEPDSKDFGRKMKAQVDPQAEAVGKSIAEKLTAPLGKEISAGVVAGVREGGRAAQATAIKQGEDTGAAFGRVVKARITSALKALPKIEIDADSSKAERETARLRAQLEALSDIEIDVNVDYDEAIARIGQIRESMSRLAKQIERDKADIGRHDIRINVDAIKAFADLTALKREVTAIQKEAARQTKLQVDAGDSASQVAKVNREVATLRSEAGRPMRIQVDADSNGVSRARAGVRDLGDTTEFTSSRLTRLLSIGIGIGPAIIPGAAAAAAAVGAIGAAAVVGVAALGTLGLGFSGISDAVGALGDVAADQSSGKAAAAQNAVADAINRVSQAQRGLRNATLDAQDAQIASSQRLADAESRLVTEQGRLLRTQLDVNEARNDARRSLEDMAASVQGGLIAERRAVQQLEQAQERLRKVKANKSATDDDREDAQLDVDEAELRLANQKRTNERLAADKAKADQAGIEGSDKVVQAQQRVADQVARIADAERGVTDARRAQEAQARHSAEAIISAQEGVVAAQNAVRDASVAAGGSMSASAIALQRAMDNLSPAGQRFAQFLYDLQPVLNGLRFAAQEGLLPGVEAGIRLLLPLVPALTVFVGNLAKVMGDLFLAGAEALTSPFWREFFGYIASIAGPTIVGFAQFIGYLAEGFAGLVLAFAPVTEQIGGGLLSLAKGFANLATTAGASAGFQAFVAYVVENGPIFWGLLGDILIVILKLGVALAPLGALMVVALGAVFDFLAALDPGVLIAIAAAIGAIGLAFLIIVAPVSASVLGVTAAIVAIVGAVAYAYEHFEFFRNAVQAVGDAIAVVFTALYQALKPTLDQLGQDVMWLWENAIKPAFGAIADFTMNVLGPAIIWLWQNVIEPAFVAIGFVIGIAYAQIRLMFMGIAWVIENVLAPYFMWLWRTVIEPAWAAIVHIIRVAWAIISVIFGLIQIALMVVGAAFTRLWQNVIGPAWAGIRAAVEIGWAYIKPIFSALGDFIGTYVAPVFKRGVDAIAAAWNLLREAAKAPVKFIIEKVLNEGIIGGFNWIAGKFGVATVAPVPMPFASGGYVSGPGGPRDDLIPARLSNGEYVIPADKVRKYGVAFFDQIRGDRPLPRIAGDGSEGIAFADGGLVGFLSSAWNTLTDPLGTVKAKMSELLGGIPGGGFLKDLLGSVGRKVIEAAMSFLGGKITNATSADGAYVGPITATTEAAKAFVQAQNGKPYVWASAGPGGYDCSGIVSATWNLLHGKNPYNHTFSTHSQASYFPLPGWGGPLTSGWSHPGQKGGGDVGHTAGNVAGLAFESRGGDGVVVGPRATGVNTFANIGHFDQGGLLLPGLTFAYNGTGKPETIRTAEQEQALSVSQRGSGPSRVTNVYPQYATLDIEQYRALDRELEIHERYGRPN